MFVEKRRIRVSRTHTHLMSHFGSICLATVSQLIQVLHYTLTAKRTDTKDDSSSKATAETR
jgi:hypothetical protein